MKGLESFIKFLTGFLLLVLVVEALGFGSNQNNNLPLNPVSSVPEGCFGLGCPSTSPTPLNQPNYIPPVQTSNTLPSNTQNSNIQSSNVQSSSVQPGGFQTTTTPIQNSVSNPSFTINNPVGVASVSTQSEASSVCFTNLNVLTDLGLAALQLLCQTFLGRTGFKNTCDKLGGLAVSPSPPSECVLIGAQVYNRSCNTSISVPYSVCRSYWDSGWEANWWGPCPKCPAGYVRDKCDWAWWDFAISSKTYCHKDVTVIGSCTSGSTVKTFTQNITIPGFEEYCDTTMIISNVNVVVNALNESASVSWTDSVYGNASVSYSGPVSGSQSTPFTQNYNHNITLTGLTPGEYFLNIKSCNNVSGCASYNTTFNLNSVVRVQVESPVNTTYTFNTPLFLNFTVNGSLASYNASYIINNSQPVFLNVVNGFNSIQLPNLGVGSYGLTLNVYAGSQNASQTVWFSVINATPNVSLSANSWNVVYGNVSNVSCSSSDNGSLVLYRNLTVVSNPDVEVLGGGAYNYTCAFTGYGYTPTNVSNTLVVKPGESVTMVLLNNSNSNLSMVYGASVIVNYSVTPNGLTTVLYENGSVIPNNFNTSSLSSGFYNFTAVTQGNANYSGSSDSKFLNISKANSILTLFLNGSASNLTIPAGGVVNSTAILNPSNGIVTLNVLGVNYSGIGFVQSVNQFNTSGVYQVQAWFNGSVNYTSSNQSFFVNVTPVVLNSTSTSVFLNGSNSNLTIVYGSSVIVNYSVNVSGLTTVLYENGSVIPNNFNSSGLPAGFYNFTAVTQGNANYSGSSDSKFLTINKAPTQLSLLLNGSNGNLTVQTGQLVNITASLNISDNITLSINGSNQTALQSITNVTSFSNPGNYSIQVFYNGNANYSSSFNSSWVIVNQAPPQISFIAWTYNNLSLGESEQLNVSVNSNGTLNVSLSNGSSTTPPQQFVIGDNLVQNFTGLTPNTTYTANLTFCNTAGCVSNSSSFATPPSFVQVFSFPNAYPWAPESLAVFNGCLYASAINSSVLGVGGVWKSCTPWNSTSWVEVLQANETASNAVSGTGEWGFYTLKVLNVTQPIFNGSTSTLNQNCLYATTGGNGTLTNGLNFGADLWATCDGSNWSVLYNETRNNGVISKLVGLNVFNGDLISGYEYNNTGNGGMFEWKDGNATGAGTNFPSIVGVWNGSWYLGYYDTPVDPGFDLARNNTLASSGAWIPFLPINTGDAAQGTMITGFYNTTQNGQNTLYTSLSVLSNFYNSSRNSTDGLNWTTVLPHIALTNFLNYSLDNRIYAVYSNNSINSNLNELISSSDLSNWSVNASYSWILYTPITIVEFNKHFYITNQYTPGGGAVAGGSILMST